MPFLLPAAASAVAAAAPAAAAAGASAAVSAGIGATLTSIAGNVLMNVAISAAMSVFQPQVGVAGRTFEWTLDPDGPIPFAAGRIGVPGSAVYRKTFGPDLMYYGIPSVLSGAGPIDGFEGFLADDETVTFDGTGKAISSQYAGELWYKNKLGTQPDTAITSPTGLKNGATLPGWTSAHRLSGKACYMIVMGENSKGTAFPTGEIKPLITLRGLKVYDPRRDSTYPGGSGSHRLANPATWTYSANPILWALKWTLGLWEGPNGKGAPQVDYQVGGIGAKLSGIDVPAFVAAANIADANGWTCAAYPTTDDDKHQVLTGFLQAGGAIYAQRAGKISCIQRAAPRTSIVTVSAYDTAGPLEIDTAASRIDRINTLRPRFWSEPHRWQMTALDQEVTAQAYRDEDGGVRPAGIDYPYVTNARQAGQLAALQIANTREGIAGVIPLKPHLQRIRPGDAFTITEAGFVLNGLKCLCLNTDYDPATGVVRVSFVSETDAKYPFALGQNPTPPTPQVLTPVDPRFVSPPGAGDWTVTPRPPSPGGGQLPGFDISGVVGNDTATAIIVEFGTSATGPWKQAYQGPPTVTNVPLDGLQPGVQYWVAIQYQRNQNYSDRHVYGPCMAPLLDPSPSAPTIVALQGQVTDAFGDIFDVSEDLADARGLIDAQGTEIAAARGDQPNLDSRIVQVNQAQIDGDTSNAEAIALVQARTANTEADIIDLESALATETGARAQAIQQVTARLNARENKIVNSTAALGYEGWPGTYGARPPEAYPNSGASPTFGLSFDTGGSGLTGGRYQTARFSVDANAPYSFQAELSAYLITAGSVRAYVTYEDGAGNALTTHGVSASVSGGYVRLTSENFATPTGTVRGVVNIDYAGASFSPGGYAGWRRLKLEPGPVCTTWTDDASTRALSASVTEQSLAIIDLETQQALASYQLIAAATGGKPARFALVSSTAGSYVAIDAPYIFWGDNTVFDDATDTLQTIVGPNIRVLAFGAPFGATGNLLEWWGPSSIALGAMTTANGLNGRMSTAPYVFDNVVPSSQPVQSKIANFSGNIGRPAPVNVAGQTDPMTVPSSGRFIVELTNGVVESFTESSGLLRLYISKDGSETQIGSLSVSASGGERYCDLSTLNMEVSHAFAGPVAFVLKANGNGPSTEGPGTVTGTLKATYYP